MSNSPTDDLLARLQALPPAEQKRLLAQFGVAPPPPAVSMGSHNQFGDTSIGDVVGGDMLRSGDIAASTVALGEDAMASSIALSDDARINGVAVGINLGTIIYGRDPSEDERRRLAWYLAQLANKLSRMPLRGLEERLDHGQGVTLAGVYVALAVRQQVELAQVDVEQQSSYFPEGTMLAKGADATLLKAYHPEYALPDRAVIYMQWMDRRLLLYRHRLASEALLQHERLVLLGDPGGGKSTFLRHLAWALALRGLDQLSDMTTLHGWEDAQRRLPIILPLRTLAGCIATTGAQETTVFAALRAVMNACCVLQVDDLLSAALDQGSALLLCDGLDEVPLKAVPGVSADRTQTLEVLRTFALMYPKVQIVITCRVRAFDDLLRTRLGWPVETIDAFTLGQVRHFVPAWYAELVARKQITLEQAQRLSATLIESIIVSPKLTEMAKTPLLLTLMALVLFNKGELPRDRPQLYERILDLLLGQWDMVREGRSLAEAIGLPDWDSSRFQPLLDQLSYHAHLTGCSEDGRGRLDRGRLYIDLIDFFKHAQVPSPGDSALAWLDYIEQRSGLLAPDGPDSYVFAHLTIQEHCAGRHIALNSEDPVGVVMDHRADDRWREPIFLGVGLMLPAVLNLLLSELIEAEGKDLLRWYRDLILAAELGQDRDWNYLRTRPMLKVERLQRELRRGLVALLNDSAQPLPIAERVRAGFLLGDLGDPRFPVTLDEWRRELERAGQPDSYFCRVEPGVYVIGSAADDPDADDNEKPQHTIRLDQPLYIARYPITNAQWRVWVAQGGGKSSYYADDADLNRPNQPVVSITWYQSNTFCTWLSTQVGASIRLPSEYEWEAAARGESGWRYPWGDDWRDDHAATEEDSATRGWRWTVPVGCYPLGAASCGAMDMAGNVLEWTTSVWHSYPGAEESFTDDELRVLRGDGYGNDQTNARCGARFSLNPGLNLIFNGGFRVVLAHPISHTS
ncbi:SUMF1/EgtB/PvdO family nonheme iron enzyme [Candidatus Oscillochloris fontis]|uniref:SUMF1/EgtB/PvdO family nonheme iron enzyme n=1 Tax=Candidatus Oscillochloris fontis TaxID=2496868 RepID=UPI00101D1521|nr:SUMF1/EgtB/PvdO family nonheme iron enzyme [Candidatus Oscillochloris fontis]